MDEGESFSSTINKLIGPLPLWAWVSAACTGGLVLILFIVSIAVGSSSNTGTAGVAAARRGVSYIPSEGHTVVITGPPH